MATFTATVNSSKVAATLTDYPAYVDLSEMPVSFWSTVTNGGGDIRCYSDEGLTTELAREVVFCDTTTDTGELHVKIPSLTTSTVIYVDVDGARSDYAVTDTYGRNNVWTAYHVVYHLQEDGNTTSGGYADSTGDFAATGVSMTSADDEAAMLGNGQRMDGSSDYIDLPILGEFTAWHLSYWFKTDNHLTDQNVVSADGQGFDDSLLTGVTPETSSNSTSDRIAAIHQRSSTSTRLVTDDTAGTASNTWYRVVSEYDGTTMELIVDGTSRETASDSGRSISNVDKWLLGANSGTTARRFDGVIDEVRIGTSAKGVNWALTEYNNQSAPDTFWTLAEAGGGGEEPTFTPKVAWFM